MKCLYTASLVDLLSEAITCCRDRMPVAAGMWLNEARDCIPHIQDQKTARCLWEAVYEAIEIASNQTAAANALHQLRGGRSKRTSGVPVGLPSAERRADTHVQPGVP